MYAPPRHEAASGIEREVHGKPTASAAVTVTLLLLPAEADPTVLVAVTVHEMALPRSPLTVTYVLDVAPPILTPAFFHW